MQVNRQQQRSRLTIGRMIRRTNMIAGNVKRLRKENDDIRKRLDDFLKLHEEYDRAKVSPITIFGTINLAHISVFALDFFICASVAEHISRAAISQKGR